MHESALTPFPMPEAWLSGPVEGIPDGLMPAAHSLIDAVRELENAASALSIAELWLRPGGAASVGFHLRHVAGSTGRLLTYARGEGLTPEQLKAISGEGEPGDPPADADALIAALRSSVTEALDGFRSVDPSELHSTRLIGRARLPSTVQGVLFHAAEHARRHAGQAIATSRIIRGMGLG